MTERERETCGPKKRCQKKAVVIVVVLIAGVLGETVAYAKRYRIYRVV